MPKPKETVRAYRGYDVDAVSDETGLACLDPSKTIQSQEPDSNINVILERFGITGQLPVNVRVPQYADFIDGVDDYRTAIHAVREAEASFMAMPANVRSRFDNDPQLFLDFCADPSNLDEMRRLGLAVPAVPAVVPDPPATGGVPPT